ncbi:MAG: UDP-N-acetylmuramoyl-L-alanine--D-glutamate ligase [Firmicutes bacterium]|nr:UDP-N-acetylmuramoyl-L-alanine--D-glutamate ligase [Bacillota bacterium]
MSEPRRIGIVGLGINNRPLVPFFLAEGEALAVFDQRSPQAIEEDLAALGARGDVRVYGGPGYLEALATAPLRAAYITPGMRKFGPAFDALRARGVHVTCETDLFLSRCPAPVIGITGSAGKTTTTTLVGEMLRRDGRRPVYVGGNIGKPLLPELAQISADSWVVMELSSFQLDLVEHSPAGAALLNIRPNHLDIHRDFEDYQRAKANILRFQRAEDWAVLGYDDPVVRQVSQGMKARQVYFSLEAKIPRGACLEGEMLVWRDQSGSQPVVGADALRLVGRHNVANALAALAMAVMAGARWEAIREALTHFAGVPHRLEMVAEVRGIQYVNDSIATAPDRTMAALEAITRPIVLLLGGYDKHLDYEVLGPALRASSVRLVVVSGATREKMRDVVQRFTAIPCIEANNFDEAVGRAVEAARPGDVVLLSPAAASYDEFVNFEERGRRFRELVAMLTA